MAELADAFFGTICLKNELLNEEQLRLALRQQQEQLNGGTEQSPLGEILQTMGFLTAEEVQEVLDAQRKTEVLLEDSIYGDIAVANDLISVSQLSEALSIQRASNYSKRWRLSPTDRA